MQQELTLQKSYLKAPVSTIYFGGGTPSVLTIDQITSLINAIKENFVVADDVEVTFEANPDDLTEDYLIALKHIGINRLSIGVQSFDEEVLTFLNRAHNSQQAINCIAMANKLGFDNISVDLIYGIPSRNNEQWRADIEQLVKQHPLHISAYCLTIEPQTAFGNWVSKGKLKPVSDDFSASQFDILIDRLEAAGYEQYEVSNFCRDGGYSKHNTAYWQQKPYLGIGPSAHSYNLNSRQYNVSNNVAYVKALTEKKVPCTIETLSNEDVINDYLLTTLRTKWGSELNQLKSWGYKPNNLYLNQLKLGGLMENNDEVLILTKKGKLLADEITAKLFI